MTALQKKTFHIETKIEDTKTRRISGFASTRFKDRAGDVVLPSALEKSMQIYSKNPVVLRDHDHSKPIGKMVDYKVTDDGLFVVDEIGKRFQEADDAWAAIDQGILSAFSIGFIPLEVDRADGEFTITELELVEHSVVSIPANRESLFSVEKAFKDGSDLVARKDGDPVTKTLGLLELYLKKAEELYSVMTLKQKIRLDDIVRRIETLVKHEETNKEKIQLEIDILQSEIELLDGDS
jgi:HK97 family phage prohead protease